MGKYSLIRLLKNIKFLMTHSLKDRETELMYNTLCCAEDLCRYDVLDPDDTVKIPHILTPEASLQLLLDNPKSFARFGDGEVSLIQGNSIAFQDYDPRLAQIMAEAISGKVPDLYVGINYNYFHTSRHMNEHNRRFYLTATHQYRQFLLENCSKDQTYIAAGFNQMYIMSDDQDLGAYYNKIKELFRDRDLVIFAGEGILDGLENDVFELARSKEYVAGPKRNAFSMYDELLEKARSYSKEKTLCFILGPASKALICDLTKDGYMAWDIGHMAKDYDFFCKQQAKTPEQINAFFAPD